MRWKESVSRGSRLTSENYFRKVRKFCIENNIQPEDLIKKNVKDIQNLLDDNVTRLEKEGKAGGYITTILKSVRSWLSHNDIKLNRRIKVSKATSTPTIENEKVPTQADLKTILNQSTVRGRSIIGLMSQSGIRPQVLGDGTDGLKIGDLPELQVKDGKYSFSKTPAIVNVRADLSKTSSKYLTFLSSEGCEYVLAHIQDRINLGEELGPDSPIVGYEKSGRNNFLKKRDSIFLTQKTTMRDVRIALKKANFDARPYVLRAYFASMLNIAEHKQQITHSNSQFFMGHKGEMLARYTTNKGRLPEDMIEGMREEYQRSENFLMTTARTNDTIAITRAEIKAEVTREILERMVGPEMLTELYGKKTANRDLPPTPEEELKILKEIEAEEIQKREGIQGNIGDRVLVLPISKLQKFLIDNPQYEEKMPVNGNFFLVNLKTYK